MIRAFFQTADGGLFVKDLTDAPYEFNFPLMRRSTYVAHEGDVSLPRHRIRRYMLVDRGANIAYYTEVVE